MQQALGEQFMRQLKRKWWVLCLFPFLLLTGTWVVTTYFLSPIYSSTTQVLVTTPVGEDNAVQGYDNIRSSIQLSETFSTTMSSSRTIQQAVEKMDVPMGTAAEVGEQVTIKGSTNSLVFTIRVTDKDPEQAQGLANMLANVIQDDFPTLFSGTEIIVLEPANEATTVGRLVQYILAVSFGVGIALVFILIKANYDTFVRKREALEKIGIRYLGDIPFIS